MLGGGGQDSGQPSSFLDLCSAPPGRPRAFSALPSYLVSPSPGEAKAQHSSSSGRGNQDPSDLGAPQLQASSRGSRECMGFGVLKNLELKAGSHPILCPLVQMYTFSLHFLMLKNEKNSTVDANLSAQCSAHGKDSINGSPVKQLLRAYLLGLHLNIGPH